MFGVDYVSGPAIDALKAAGVTFVCRYLSQENEQTKIKLLSLGEAKMLSQAGIPIVSNYEWYANRAIEGRASGVPDAQIAAAQHAACGGPASKPIYFSVDEDVSGDQVADYFRGVSSVIGLARTGAYGSYRVLKYLFDNHLITWGWQAYAWSGGQWEIRAHIQQYQNGMSIAGASVDYNRAIKSDFGQWLVGQAVSAERTNDMIDITDKWVATYFKEVAVSPHRWQCNNGQSLFAGVLAGWRAMNGAPRLPTGPETKCGKTAVYQQCESGIVLHDPDKELDAPGGPWAPCYLLKLDSDLAKKLLNVQPPQPTINVPDVVAQLRTILTSGNTIIASGN